MSAGIHLWADAFRKQYKALTGHIINIEITFIADTASNRWVLKANPQTFASLGWWVAAPTLEELMDRANAHLRKAAA